MSIIFVKIDRNKTVVTVAPTSRPIIVIINELFPGRLILVVLKLLQLCGTRLFFKT